MRTILPASMIGAAAGAMSFVTQTAFHVSPQSVTWFVAALALLEAAGSMAGARQVRFVRTPYLLAAAAPALAAALLSPSLVSVSALLLAALDGAAYPARATAIQSLATDSIRARAASLSSACDMAISSMTLPLTGILRSRRRS